MANRVEPCKFGNVVAHGLDLVAIKDFSIVVIKHSAFLDRYFTAAELSCADQTARRIEKLASRFAIKEAVLKALGAGWGDGISYTDVEVLSDPTGAPHVELHRKLLLIANARGITRWLVSASHISDIAVASVIAVSGS